MCEFKFCRGSGTCFLNKTSPCVGFDTGGKVRTKNRSQSIRLRYDGFLDQDTLLDVLETPAPAESFVTASAGGLSKLVTSAPRFLSRKNAASSGQSN